MKGTTKYYDGEAKSLESLMAKPSDANVVTSRTQGGGPGKWRGKRGGEGKKGSKMKSSGKGYGMGY